MPDAKLRKICGKVASMDPHYGTVDRLFTGVCFFCGNESDVEHEPDCLWLRLKRALAEGDRDG